MLHTTPATNVRFLLLKSGPGSGAKIAHQAGYAFYGSRWHKISADKPAPKGAPVASHPEAGGAHIPKAHFTDDQWSQLKLPDTNVNAKSFNNALAKLKEWSDAGNVTAILGAGFGTNTYGKKLAAIANSLLAAHGSTHKVTAGQKAGEHGAVLAAPAGAKPAEAASADAPLGAYSAEPVEAPAIGAKVPNQTNSATIPASTLAEAIAKGTAKKVTDTVSKPAAPAPKDTDPMSDWTAFTGKHWGDVQEVDDAAPFLKDPKKAGPAALSAYGSSGFTEINSDPSAPVSKALLSYIGKLPAFDSSKQLHRVMGFDSSDAVGGFLKQLAPSATEPGAQIKTVSSWTTNDPSAPDQTPMNNIALDLAEQFGDHKVFLTLESGHQSAKDVSFLYSKDGKSKGGTDVLLPHGTRLDVVSVKKDGLNTHVVVREVHEGDTKPAADGGTLVLKDGHWVKQGEPAPTGNLAMPDFQEGKTVTGVKALYEKVGQKIIDFAQAGDVASLEAIAEPGKKMWAGKTPNSKLLLALRSAALAQAKGEPVPVAVDAPAVEAAHAPSVAAVPPTEPPSTSSKKVTIGGVAFVAVKKTSPNGSFWIPAVEATGQEIDHQNYGSIKGMWEDLAHVAKIKGDKFAASMGVKESSAPAGTVMVDGKPLLADKDGKPKVYYHGTGAKAHDGNFKEGSYGGIYFASEPDVSATYVDGSADNAHEAGGADAVEQKIFARSIVAKNPMIVPEKADNLDHLHLVAEAKKKGHDALVLQNVETEDGDKLGEFVIVFSNDSIVPAAGNVADSVADPVSSKGEKFAHDGSGTLWHDTAKPAAAGPKEGDTKPGANGGTLVLKDGHWVKQGGDEPAGAPVGSTVDMDGLTYKKNKYGDWVAGGMKPISASSPTHAKLEALAASDLSADQLGKLQSIPWFKQKLPAENTNAKSHNAAVAKIEAMAFAGDKAGLQAFIDAKAGAKQTYAKKQHLLAQTALAALQAGAPSAEPSLAGKPAYDHIAHTMKAGGSGLSAADQWIAANPGEWGELNDALSAHGFGHLADYGPAGAPDAGTAPPQGPTVNTPVPADVKKTIDGMASQGNKAGLESVAANNPNNPHVAAYAQKKLDEFSDPTADTPLLPAQLDALQKFSPSQLKVVSGTGLPPNVQAWIDKKLAQPTKVKVDAPLYTNTEPGHNKFWSVSTSGKVLKTEYGKIGTMGTSAVKEFATAQEAMDAAVKLVDQKKNKGYKYQGSVKHEHDVAAVDVAPMGGWSHKASDPGMSGAPTLSSDDGTIVLDPVTGHSEYHDSASLESMDPTSVLSADSLHDLVQKMAANGQPVPPLAALQKLSPSFKASDLPAGPKDGDTKMGADGLLVFKDGRWHKQSEPEPTAKKLTQQGISAAFGGKVPENSIIDAAKKAAKEGDADGINAAWWAADAKGFAKTAAAIGKLAAAMGVKIKPQGQSAGAPDHGTAPSVSAPVAATAAPSADTWEQTGPQLGSNPGGKFKDASGQEWYIKWPDDAEAVKSEVLAAKLYAMAGLSSQDCMLVTKGGKMAIATKWSDIKKAKSAAALAAVDGVQSGFAVDAWLGNWDVVGASLDNLQVGQDGKAHRVDAGGSLEYRAQGGKKPFGAKVEEIDTLRDKKKNPKAAAVFGLMSDADITASVAKVAAISDSQIRALVFEHGPGDDAARKELAATLIARKEDLLTRFPAAAKPTKKLLDRSALPVNPASIPKPHDFENWNGPGKGLSAKDHVNKANAAVEAQMQALAQSGNMIALQAFKFAQVDKETGALTGEMVPVSKHPSKHVQQYQQDLLQILDEVANPPEPLKVFRETDVGTLAALNAAFPPKPFGTTVSKVASNEKLGFWVALGAVAGAQKFAPSKFSNYSSAAVAAAKEKYASASKLAKHFIKSVQSSGSYNDLFRDGKTHDSSGNDLKDVAKAALAHATEMPEGTTLYRWQKMSPQMLQHIMSAKDGTVFQATGPMCTSYSATATSKFGTHRVVVRYAKGAKAVESFGSGGFPSEKEVTTLPNARFVILSKKMVPDQEHGKPGSERLELEILMLPPDLGL